MRVLSANSGNWRAHASMMAWIFSFGCLLMGTMRSRFSSTNRRTNICRSKGHVTFGVREEESKKEREGREGGRREREGELLISKYGHVSFGLKAPRTHVERLETLRVVLGVDLVIVVVVVRVVVLVVFVAVAGRVLGVTGCVEGRGRGRTLAARRRRARTLGKESNVSDGSGASGVFGRLSEAHERRRKTKFGVKYKIYVYKKNKVHLSCVDGGADGRSGPAGAALTLRGTSLLLSPSGWCWYGVHSDDVRVSTFRSTSAGKRKERG